MLIFGKNPVKEALLDTSVALDKLTLSDKLPDALAKEFRALANARKVVVQVVPYAKLQQLTKNGVHQGVALSVADIPFADFFELLNEVATDVEEIKKTCPLLIALDGITDPHNFGAIVRSAVAVGAKGIIVPERSHAPLNATVVKTSAGGALRIPIAKVPNLSDAILHAKEFGFWVAGLEGTAEKDIWEMDWKRPYLLVIGSEGEGMKDRVKKNCDFLVKIPMHGNMESLNASVAAGITMFAMKREP